MATIVSNSPSGAVIVPPHPVETAGDIRGLKPPVEIPNGWVWVGWVLMILAMAAVAWLLWRRRTRPGSTIPAAPIVPPYVRARQRLEAALSLLSDPRSFCILVSDTIRVYLEEQFHFRAPERTTEEFLAELKHTEHLNSDQKESLGEFLGQCDLVKFARHEPTEADLRSLHHAACRLVDETRFEWAEAIPAAATQAAS